MGKIKNWSKTGDLEWEHDKFSLKATLKKEETKDAYDHDYVWVGRVEDNELRGDGKLYFNETRNKTDGKEQLIDFLKRRPYDYNSPPYVMNDPKAVQLVTRGMYSGYPWIEPDGRMPEEDGTGEFPPGDTVQGYTETLGELDWGILNSIDDKTVKEGYYTTHRDVHQDYYVIVGEDEEHVKMMKSRMEGLDERTLDEDETVDRADYDMLNQDADVHNVEIAMAGRHQRATEHETVGDNEIIAVDGKAYVAEKVNT